jgi:DNA-binding beta-propeller fold protein YncE
MPWLAMPRPLCDPPPVRRAVLPLLVAVTTAATATAGCGSATVHELPPAAGPARSPALQAMPAGRILHVGTAPEGVAADAVAHELAVAVRSPDRLVLVDARTGATKHTVDLPAGPRRRVHDAAPAVFVVPAETGAHALTITPGGTTTIGDHPHDAAVVAGRTFVGNERSNTVSVLDGGRETARFPVATQPGGLAGVDADRALAVVSVRERVLELYDPHTLKRIARAPAGVGPTHVVSEADRLYVADTQGGALLVFQTRPKLTLTRRVDLPGSPYGIAIDPIRHRLWITLTARNELVALSAHGHARVTLRLPAVRQPDAVAVDSALGIVAVAGRSAGVLQLIGGEQAYPEGR